MKRVRLRIAVANSARTRAESPTYAASSDDVLENITRHVTQFVSAVKQRVKFKPSEPLSPVTPTEIKSLLTYDKLIRLLEMSEEAREKDPVQEQVFYALKHEMIVQTRAGVPMVRVHRSRLILGMTHRTRTF